MDETNPQVAGERRGQAIAAELRWLSWVLLAVYTLVAVSILFVEIRFHDPVYPLFRTQYGLTIVPGFLVAWLALLILDLGRRLSWKWLAGMIIAAAVNLTAYVIVDAYTQVPG